MDPRVRDLYKRFLYVGRDYPLGLPYVREKVKDAFFKTRHLKDPIEIKKAVKKGRYIVRELIGVIQLKKYRTLNNRYTSEELQDALRNIRANAVIQDNDKKNKTDWTNLYKKKKKKKQVKMRIWKIYRVFYQYKNV